MTLWLLGHRDLQDAGYPHEPYLQMPEAFTSLY